MTSLRRMGIGTLLALGLSFSFSVLAEDALARYTTVQRVPSVAQRDLLSMEVPTNFVETVRTVGEAIESVLLTTGYRLSSTMSADPMRSALLSLPLPGVHRSLTGLTARDALKLLAGPAFTLVEDPLHRLVSFEQCGPAMASSPADTRPQ